MMAMMATTMSSSIRVKPRSSLAFMSWTTATAMPADAPTGNRRKAQEHGAFRAIPPRRDTGPTRRITDLSPALTIHAGPRNPVMLRVLQTYRARPRLTRSWIMPRYADPADGDAPPVSCPWPAARRRTARTGDPSGAREVPREAERARVLPTDGPAGARRAGRGTLRANHGWGSGRD